MSAALRIELSIVQDAQPSPLEQLAPVLPHVIELLRLYSDFLKPKAKTEPRNPRGTFYADDFLSSFGSGPSTVQCTPAGTSTFDTDEDGDADNFAAEGEENLIGRIRAVRTFNPNLFRKIQHLMREPVGNTDADDGVSSDGETESDDGEE